VSLVGIGFFVLVVIW